MKPYQPLTLTKVDPSAPRVKLADVQKREADIDAAARVLAGHTSQVCLAEAKKHASGKDALAVTLYEAHANMAEAFRRAAKMLDRGAVAALGARAKRGPL